MAAAAAAGTAVGARVANGGAALLYAARRMGEVMVEYKNFAAPAIVTTALMMGAWHYTSQAAETVALDERGNHVVYGEDFAAVPRLNYQFHRLAQYRSLSPSDFDEAVAAANDLCRLARVLNDPALRALAEPDDAVAATRYTSDCLTHVKMLQLQAEKKDFPKSLAIDDIYTVIRDLLSVPESFIPTVCLDSDIK
jgi:hypothetical protein